MSLTVCFLKLDWRWTDGNDARLVQNLMLRFWAYLLPVLLGSRSRIVNSSSDLGYLKTLTLLTLLTPNDDLNHLVEELCNSFPTGRPTHTPRYSRTYFKVIEFRRRQRHMGISTSLRMLWIGFPGSSDCIAGCYDRLCDPFLNPRLSSQPEGLRPDPLIQKRQ